MMTVPSAFLEELHLQAGATVGLIVEDGQMIIEPKRARYTREDLLAQCDLEAPLSSAEREWVDTKDVGLEILPDVDAGHKA
jgi:antitoxin ChpS